MKIMIVKREGSDSLIICEGYNHIGWIDEYTPVFANKACRFCQGVGAIAIKKDGQPVVCGCLKSANIKINNVESVDHGECEEAFFVEGSE
jgi:hypothetical protein